MPLTELGTGKSPAYNPIFLSQAIMHAFTDRPELRGTGKRCQRLQGKIGQKLVKLPHESLVGTEDDSPNPVGIGDFFPFHRSTFAQADAQSQFNGMGVIRQGTDRFFVLADARCRQGLHRPDDGLQVSWHCFFFAGDWRVFRSQVFLACRRRKEWRVEFQSEILQGLDGRVR